VEGMYEMGKRVRTKDTNGEESMKERKRRKGNKTKEGKG